MEQEIRHLEVSGRRVAYATCGAGPPMVFGPRWVCDLDEEWADLELRAFYSDLARTHTVVRFDRIGTGRSSRALDPLPSVEDESRQLEAVVRAAGGAAVIFATSCCGLSASRLAIREPALVTGIVFFGAYASRNDIPDATKQSLVEFTRVNWMLAAQLFAGLFDPHASGDDILRYTRHQRAAATAEAAAALLELDLTSDLRDVLPNVDTPALVLHRRGDRTVPIGRGRELASLLPNARFVPLSGDAHLPWRGDRRELMRALAGFLQPEAPSVLDGASPLTGRETEVLRLVSSGMSNREIAGTLVLSEHTVHRHVANILRKLSESTRAGAATHAVRAGIL
jgi:pimeloyl-ACP methyl ester carboxylesterase/DNA-binding CsgD family transcriptional regulator